MENTPSKGEFVNAVIGLWFDPDLAGTQEPDTYIACPVSRVGDKIHLGSRQGETLYTSKSFDTPGEAQREALAGASTGR